MANFWETLPKPFLVLAPMDDVTDVVFREIIAKASPPDVFFTEFTSADGLNSPGRQRVIQKLKYTNNQKPIVAQIWGNHPENIYKASKLISDLGFDGVDINMGCPDKTIMKKESGSGAIGNYHLAKEIISAAKDGAKDISVSVKTRLGKKENISDEWMPFLLEQGIDALTIHGRTAEQQSKGQADWSEIGKIVTIKNAISPQTTIIGNGDIKTYEQAVHMHKNHKVDGIMIGRGIFSYPWVFEKIDTREIRTKRDYITILLNHLDLFDETWGDTKNFEIMKKFFKMYINNFNGASLLRQRLMECKNSSQAREILNLLV